MFLISLRKAAAIEVCAVEAVVDGKVSGVGVLDRMRRKAQQERPRRRSLRARSVVDDVFTIGVECDQPFGFERAERRCDKSELGIS